MRDIGERYEDRRVNRTTTLRRRLLVTGSMLWVGLALASAAPRTATAGPADPVADAVAALTPQVNLGVPIDVVFNPPLNGINDLAYPSVRSRSTLPQIAVNEALAYAWITGTATGWLGVAVDIAFPPAQNAWDCSHSIVSYGLWIRATRSDPWTHWGSGTFYGFWKDGLGCYLNNGPENTLKDGSTVTEFGAPGGGLVFEYLVGAKKWAHNDPSLGHSGRCKEVNCYFGGKIRIATSKL